MFYTEMRMKDEKNSAICKNEICIPPHPNLHRLGDDDNGCIDSLLHTLLSCTLLPPSGKKLAVTLFDKFEM